MIVFVALLCVLGFGFDAFYLGVGGGYVPVGSLMALGVGTVSGERRILPRRPRRAGRHRREAAR